MSLPGSEEAGHFLLPLDFSMLVFGETVLMRQTPGVPGAEREP